MSGKFTVQKIGAYTVIEFAGPSLMDPIELEDMSRQLYALVEVEDRRKIILDFEKVDYLSSQAIGMIMGMMKKIGAVKGRLILCSIGPKLRELIRIVGLEKVLMIKATQQEAIAAGERFG